MQDLFGIKSPLATERQRFSLARIDDRDLMRRRISFGSIRIMLASPETIRGWSHGEVTKPETINLPLLQAGAGRPVLREDLGRSRTGVQLRQVQAHPPTAA